MKKKVDFKKLITFTNVLSIILIIMYLLDCYLPLPEGYTGYTSWISDSSSVLIIFSEVAGDYFQIIWL